ncbi:L-2-hydroxyglutarate oxidase LhgO [Methyloglobulus morosus KoM1]|uniref:L-2-hydroxyglutarate oxidase LhgO n=1 Tax=Methyloglobulus morosus KoM1 TaxID=1116472 RepID=V5BD74_9GAMM|nr:L-2-hydroxyglutarate oxidase [Methyloglobulus morosus]ESS71235.1 L-2-hydroxyglutarate oxidase LhgO [Methyloglobulus morosus KoM1]
MNKQKSFLVIGGGLVGLATAYRLLERFPSAKLILLEKETKVGMHQSTHNSGVLHAGLYYAPGSAKAKLAVTGIKQMVEFCRMEHIAHEICGKLVVAVTPEELPRLDELFRRGISNGLKGLKKLDRDEARKLEPNVNALAAVHVPEEGIVDYRQVCDRMAAIIQDRGGQIVTDAKVVQINLKSGMWLTTTSTKTEFTGDFLVNCAGLYCDRVAELAGEKREVRIVPFRGEYYLLKPSAGQLVKNLVYPVPNPEFPFLGVHFTRMIHGGVEAGPNAVLAFAREGYHFSKIDSRDLLDALLFPGLWRFLRKYPAMAFSEFAQSLSKDHFCKTLQRLVPDIRIDDLVPGHAGVRAQAMSATGDLVNDFHLVVRHNAIHVINAPSPAATASLAIGEHIVNQL